MVRNAKKKKNEERPVWVPPAERLLMELLPDVEGPHVLCTSLGRGQFAAALAEAQPQTQVYLQYHDLYEAEEARREAAKLKASRAGESRGENLRIECAADFPALDFDAVALAVPTTEAAELTRDVLQSGYQVLRPGGRMLAAIDKRKEQWLHEELQKLFPKVTRREVGRRGVQYLATKTTPPRKYKNFECEFAFRDRERLIRAISRPGVFSHRSIDAGSRALLNTMEIRDGERVLDYGCGSGIVALAAALRAPGVNVTAIDSNARAVDCAQRGAAMNELTNVTVRLGAEAESVEAGVYDRVLGNPPYYSDFRIAEIFLQAAVRGLKTGGEALIVTKSPAWFVERMAELAFDKVRIEPHKLYAVVRGERTEGAGAEGSNAEVSGTEAEGRVD